MNLITQILIKGKISNDEFNMLLENEPEFMGKIASVYNISIQELIIKFHKYSFGYQELADGIYLILTIDDLKDSKQLAFFRLRYAANEFAKSVRKIKVFLNNV